MGLGSFALFAVAITLGATEQGVIAARYRAMDAAYDWSDAGAYAKAFAPTLTTIQATGARATLDHGQALTRTEQLLRALPGKTVLRRESTTVTGVAPDGPDLLAPGIRVQEVLVADRAGTQDYVKDTARFQERWARIGNVWRIAAAQDSGLTRQENGRASPTMLAQLQQLRTTNGQLLDFNAANNLSKCMTSNALAGLSLNDQRARCPR